MKVIQKGHIYAAQQRTVDGELLPINKNTPIITFVNKEGGREDIGTTTQEVIRVLLDRTRHCANCMPHPNNERIVYHLRMALVLHETRALERQTEKGEIAPEYLEVAGNGHLKIAAKKHGDLDTPILDQYRHDWDRACNHNQ